MAYVNPKIWLHHPQGVTPAVSVFSFSDAVHGSKYEPNREANKNNPVEAFFWKKKTHRILFFSRKQRPLNEIKKAIPLIPTMQNTPNPQIRQLCKKGQH